MTSHANPTRLSPELLDRLRAIVGPSHALTDPDQQLPYLRELRDMYDGRAAVVLRPGSTDEVSKILSLAHEQRIPVVPQAGNTGLVGGQVPMHGELLLSVSRLKGVRAVDAAGYTMTVETGLTLAEVQAVAEKANRLFPLSLPSEGSCQLGGNLGTNAGGVGVLAYGNTRQLVLGLEVVLADGQVWNGLKALKTGRITPAEGDSDWPRKSSSAPTSMGLRNTASTSARLARFCPRTSMPVTMASSAWGERLRSSRATSHPDMSGITASSRAAS